MFPSTLPFGEPDLVRASAFRRYLDETETDRDGLGSGLSSLSPSMLHDLLHLDRPPGTVELLEVLAACVRHGQSLLIHLEDDEHIVPLTIFPSERLVHCAMQMEQLLARRLDALRVLHLEPPILRPPGHPDRLRIGAPELHAPIGPLLWELALRGAREELLPQIAGSAAYRIAPGVDLRGLDLSASLAAAVQRLKRQTTNLREIAEWPGFDRGRAIRLLNALYLQAGLMVTRTHPAATNEGWFGGALR
jgi:hypothetical protein